MPKRTPPTTIDQYISQSSPEARPILEKIRKEIQQTAPQAEEGIRYGMPTLMYGGRFVYFAAFKRHIGIYPPIRGDAKLMQDAAPFAGEKGSLRFPLSEPIPLDLIRRIAKRRLLSQ